ncbi:3-hydroxyacyl-[acyl-carrier-protein] dehydratase [Mucilaginibacter sp. UYP25]|uniref:hypothetical protein n=1 Tax=unclassified Mucilaginibacter TaxID=2617802 RepID=UPI003397627E
MLKNSLFAITTIARQETVIEAAVIINADDRIFEGHFPGHPVLPGACMLQIIKEVLQEALGEQLILKKASSIKFLIQVDPTIINCLKVIINYKKIDALVEIIGAMIAGDSACLKLKAIFAKLT